MEQIFTNVHEQTNSSVIIILVFRNFPCCFCIDTGHFHVTVAFCSTPVTPNVRITSRHVYEMFERRREILYENMKIDEETCEDGVDVI